MPQNDRKRGVILSEAKDPGRRTIGFVYIPLFVGARAPTDEILRRFACPLVEVVATRRLYGLL